MMAPARLYKAEDNQNNLLTISGKIEAWLYRHAAFFLFLCFIVIGILFVVLVYAIVGVSATESGTVYNQLHNII